MRIPRFITFICMALMAMLVINPLSGCESTGGTYEVPVYDTGDQSDSDDGDGETSDTGDQSDSDDGPQRESNGTDNGDDEDDEGHGRIYCADADGDGYGDPTEAINSEVVSNGYVADCTDCNDDSSSVHPGASDTSSDGTDQDCDGTDGVTTSTTEYTWYYDADGDGYGTSGTTTQDDTQPSGYVSNSSDCDDSSPAINPGASEGSTANGVDDDCDGTVDDGTSSSSSDDSSSSVTTMYITVVPESSSVSWNLQVANYSRGEWTNWFASRSTTTGTVTQSVTGAVGDWVLLNGDYDGGYLAENTSLLACQEHINSVDIGTTSPATVDHDVTTSTTGADCVCLSNETDDDGVQESGEGWNIWCVIDDA